MPPIITLTTDFGLSDEYVGVMKGVIACRAPEARIIDLCHAVPRQDVRQAAWLLAASWRYFPPTTLHVVVVDPGVGSERRILLLVTDQGRFLAPDNGVLTPLLTAPGRQQLHLVSNEALFLPQRSATFHGRDIFAPVAAALVTGTEPAAIGPAIPATDAVCLALPQPRLDATSGTVEAEVVAIDHFGNLITNCTIAELAALAKAPAQLAVHLNGQPLAGISRTYADAAPGEVVVFIGSRGALEIAVNQGNAAQRLRAAIGSRVHLGPHGKK